MSQIASFYILPAKDVEDLLAAATPKSARTKSRSQVTSQDLFWDFLASNAEESAQFEFSGSVFTELELYLMAREGPMPFSMALQEPSERLTKARGASIAVFDHKAAQKAKTTLAKVDVSAKTIQRYCESGESAWATEELAEPLPAAVAMAMEWMDDVGPTDVGILIVG